MFLVIQSKTRVIDTKIISHVDKNMTDVIIPDSFVLWVPYHPRFNIMPFIVIMSPKTSTSIFWFMQHELITDLRIIPAEVWKVELRDQLEESLDRVWWETNLDALKKHNFRNHKSQLLKCWKAHGLIKPFLEHTIIYWQKQHSLLQMHVKRQLFIILEWVHLVSE